MAWDWDKLQQQKKQRSGGDRGTPPGTDDILEKFRGATEKFPGGAWLIIVIVVLIYLAYSCIFTVGVNEVGVIQQFGRYVRTVQPGLSLKLPNGIEKVTKVNIKQTFKEEFTGMASRKDFRTRYADTSSDQNETLMLTGDLNVVVVPWVVQYKIENPVDYLFQVRDPVETLSDLSESCMRLIVGDSSIDEVISERVEIADQAGKLLQEELRAARTGIRVENILMQKTNVPGPVQPSFNQVNQAIQEKETTILKAKKAYLDIIPAAEGDAEKTIKAAEGYALDRVNRAKGDTSRFLALWEEYSKAKDVTRRRLYLEAMEQIFPQFGNKYIVDADQKNLLPLLNLGKSEGEKR